jgi:hypothetical protein
MYCSSHLFPIHIIYALIFPNIRNPDPRYKWVRKSLICYKHVNDCDEEEWPQNSSQNLHKYSWCTTLSYSHGYFCSLCIELNTLASGTMTSWAQLSESEWQSDWLFCGHSSSSQSFVSVGINLVQYDCYSITGSPN